MKKTSNIKHSMFNVYNLRLTLTVKEANTILNILALSGSDKARAISARRKLIIALREHKMEYGNARIRHGIVNLRARLKREQRKAVMKKVKKHYRKLDSNLGKFKRAA